MSDDISREDIRRALQMAELRAQEETNADRAAAIRETASIIERALLHGRSGSGNAP